MVGERKETSFNAFVSPSLWPFSAAMDGISVAATLAVSSHPPRAPLSSSRPAARAPRSAEHFEFQPLGGRKKCQGRGSREARASIEWGRKRGGAQPARQGRPPSLRRRRRQPGNLSLSFSPQLSRSTLACPPLWPLERVLSTREQGTGLTGLASGGWERQPSFNAALSRRNARSRLFFFFFSLSLARSPLPAAVPLFSPRNLSASTHRNE